MEWQVKTKPRQLRRDGIMPRKEFLVEGRYGTWEMAEIMGQEPTKEYSLKVQGQAAVTLSRLYPDVIKPEIAEEIRQKANLMHVRSERIDELEDMTGHDIIGLNSALEEVVSPPAKPHIGKMRTSADTTVTARALQLKMGLEVIAESAENLRDISFEKADLWSRTRHCDQTHLYDALPTLAGRPFVHYAEMIQSGLDMLKFVYSNSIKGKWADATGNHHSAWDGGIDGIKLENEYCRDLGIGHMIAPAQIPGLEFEADVMYVLSRLAETGNNFADYVARGFGSDRELFTDENPRKRKGSSAMPHKDMKGGNRTAEEQFKSIRREFEGILMTAMSNCEFPYGRDLSGSANSRINFNVAFKFLDHGLRRLSNVIYFLGLNEDVSESRIWRSYGVLAAQRIMNYLTDNRVFPNPMARSEAHDLIGKLATSAWQTKTKFFDVLSSDEKISLLIDREKLAYLCDLTNYIAESNRIITICKDAYYQKKTLQTV